MSLRQLIFKIEIKSGIYPLVTALLLFILAYSEVNAQSGDSIYIDPGISHFLLESKAAHRADVGVRGAVSEMDRKTEESFNEENLRVILTFQHETRLSRTDFKNLELLKKGNLIQAGILRKSLGLPHLAIESIWAARSLVVRLSSEQLHRVLKMPNLVGVYWADKIIKISSKENLYKLNSPLDTDPGFHPLVNNNMTYGLKNIGIGLLRANYPDLDGRGVKVGIIDTGIDADHPELKGKLSVFKNFSPAVEQKPADGFGHGTHVAGTIAGEDKSGTWIGIAPKASLIVARIFDSNGESTRAGILQAMQWMMDPDGNPKTSDFPQVINNSWSDDEPYDNRDPEQEPFCIIVQNWKNQGMIPVFSAGNTGPKSGSINLPAGCPSSYSVAATEQWDRSPWFSSMGPANWKTNKLLKPEISAPGFEIKSSIPRNDYDEMSGTSMAAPHVTGALTILLQANPQLSVDQALGLLNQNSKDLGDPGQDYTFGFGRVDIFQTIKKVKPL